jgi:hypothetical protein
MSERYDVARGRGSVIEGERRDVSALLGDAARGHLEFASGAANLVLRVEAEMPDLFRAHFAGVVPDMEARDGSVRIRYPHFWPVDWFRYALSSTRMAADVTLNGAIPWRIEIRGGASRLDGDLSALQLEALEIGGGASRVELTLPRPSGTIPIHIGGGASHVVLHRPKGAAARIRVGGGVVKLAFDAQQFGAIGWLPRLETTGYEDTTDRYDIEIAGGAATLTIDTD